MDISAYYAPVLPAERWTSINLYRENYEHYLRIWHPERKVVNLLTTESLRMNKWARRYQRDIVYPFKLRRVKSGINNKAPLHIFDHSYGHLVKTWSPTIIHARDLNHTILPSLRGLQLMRWKQRTAGLVNADRVIAISDSLKSELIEHAGVDPSKITRIYHGVDLKNFSPDKRSEAEKQFPELAKAAESEFLILNVGTNLERKNLDTVYKALKILRKQGINARLIRVGDELVRPGEEKRRFKLGVTAHTTHLGTLPPNKIALLMTLCSVMSFASYYEGFGRPLLEAQASGLPLVAAKSSCIPEIAGKGALYHSPADAWDLAEKLATVHSQKLGGLLEEGYANTKKFSWESHFDQLLALYDEMNS